MRLGTRSRLIGDPGRDRQRRRRLRGPAGEAGRSLDVTEPGGILVPVPPGVEYPDAETVRSFGADEVPDAGCHLMSAGTRGVAYPRTRRRCWPTSCRPMSLVAFEGGQYSIPHQLAGDVVHVR
jgi:hypothetical protein